MSATKAIPLGHVVITQVASVALPAPEVHAALQRHESGDWGDCCPDDWQANEDAITAGDRLFSVYHASDGTKFWIITEHDRSLTTVLLPEDY